MCSSCLLPYICEDTKHMVGYARKNVHMKFGVPMICREQKEHSNDCYFCQQDYTGCTTAKETHFLSQLCPTQMAY